MTGASPRHADVMTRVMSLRGRGVASVLLHHRNTPNSINGKNCTKKTHTYIVYLLLLFLRTLFSDERFFFFIILRNYFAESVTSFTELNRAPQHRHRGSVEASKIKQERGGEGTTK